MTSPRHSEAVNTTITVCKLVTKFGMKKFDYKIVPLFLHYQNQKGKHKAKAATGAMYSLFQHLGTL